MATRSTTRAGSSRPSSVYLLPLHASTSWDPIVKYIKDQHSSYLRKELTAMRDRYIQDTRIHCCLYFINPTGHTLRPIDVLVMKKLSEVVNVVPVIAKADSLTLDERAQFKEVVSTHLVLIDLSIRLAHISRFAQSSSTTTSAFIPLIPRIPTRRRLPSTSPSAYAAISSRSLNLF
jgi:septin family protein